MKKEKKKKCTDKISRLMWTSVEFKRWRGKKKWLLRIWSLISSNSGSSTTISTNYVQNGILTINNRHWKRQREKHLRYSSLYGFHMKPKQHFIFPPTHRQSIPIFKAMSESFFLSTYWNAALRSTKVKWKKKKRNHTKRTMNRTIIRWVLCLHKQFHFAFINNNKILLWANISWRIFSLNRSELYANSSYGKSVHFSKTDG